jgi:hypothetical protein
MIEANMAEGHQATKELKQAMEATEADVLQALGQGPKTSMSLTIDLALTGIGFKLNVPTMGGLPKPFRTHTMLTNMVFTKQGNDTLDKLLGMFEEKNTTIGESVREHFRNKYAS